MSALDLDETGFGAEGLGSLALEVIRMPSGMMTDFKGRKCLIRVIPLPEAVIFGSGKGTPNCRVHEHQCAIEL